MFSTGDTLPWMYGLNDRIRFRRSKSSVSVRACTNCAVDWLDKGTRREKMGNLVNHLREKSAKELEQEAIIAATAT